jgi:hypothetical protein
VSAPHAVLVLLDDVGNVYGPGHQVLRLSPAEPLEMPHGGPNALSWDSFGWRL